MGVLVGRGRVGDFILEVSGTLVEVDNIVGVMIDRSGIEVGCSCSGAAMVEQPRTKNRVMITIDFFFIDYGSHTGCQSGSGSLVSWRMLWPSEFMM